MRLDVNTDASIQLTAKLEKLSKSAFPSAVRNTLNKTAFEAKKLVPEKANKIFTVRQKNLFTRFVLVEKAQGFDVNKMSSKIGIDANTRSKLAEGLEKQETGGNIKGRKLTPHNMGRVSQSYAKKVQSKHQFSKMGGVGTSKKRIKGSKYFRIDKGSNGTVFENLGKGRIKPIYNYRTNPNFKLSKRPFIKPSAEKASINMQRYYRESAEFQFNKILKR